jgi:hypothetical protein
MMEYHMDSSPHHKTKLKKMIKGNHKRNPNKLLGERKKIMLVNLWFYYVCFMLVIEHPP